MDTDTRIRQVLLESMREQGLTQIDLAKRLGVSAQAVSNVVRGDRGKIPTSLIELLGAANLELTVQPSSRVKGGSVFYRVKQILQAALEQANKARALLDLPNADALVIAENTMGYFKSVKQAYEELRRIYPSPAKEVSKWGNFAQIPTKFPDYLSTVSDIQRAVTTLEEAESEEPTSVETVETAAKLLRSVLRVAGEVVQNESPSSKGPEGNV